MSKTDLPTFGTLGEMLKYLRHRAQLTQIELSIAVGYSESQISRLEQNKRLVDAEMLLAVFVPAFGLEGQPETVKQLLALAVAAQIPQKQEGALPDPLLGRQRLDNQPLSNLPLRLTSFIGRQDAVATLQELIPATRLVTLTGVGGVGKTSLAMVVGSSLTPAFADGVWCVELAPLAEAHLVPQRIGSVFKLPDPHAFVDHKALTAYLQNRHLLLILDNCEHLIDACAEVVDGLLRTCPYLHIVTTSREALRVDGELEVPVSPLTTPREDSGSGARSTTQAFHGYEAVRLFVERARITQPAFVWNDQSAALVTALCIQLDGIPLAIELAASRLKGMTIQELSTRLGERFRLLRGGSRPALPRHQTLRAAVDWSYELLSEAERALLQRLSVFSGSWALDAVEAIADVQLNGATSIHDPVDLLLQLVNKSLVVAEPQGGETRYRLLETIRYYGAEKLQETGEVRPIQERHYRHYLALAEQSRDLTLIGQRSRLWQERMAREFDNLHAAFAWSREHRDGGECCLQLAVAMWHFWTSRGRFQEGQRWLEEALARGTAAPVPLRATALWNLADLIASSASLARRRALAEESLTLCQQVDDRSGMAFCYLLLARITAEEDDFPRALEYHERALTLFRAVNWRLMIGVSLTDLADLRLQVGHAAEAVSLYEEYLAVAREPEGHLLVEYALVRDALASLFQIDAVRGKSLFEQELASQRALGNEEALASLLHAYGSALVFTAGAQEWTDGIQALSEALGLWRRLEIKWSRAGGTARACLELTYAYIRKGELANALAHAREASQLYQGVGDTAGTASAQSALGWVALALGDLALAGASFRISLRLSPDGSMNSVPGTLVGLAETVRRQGDLVRAGRLFGAAARFEHRLSLGHLAIETLAAIKASRTYLDNPVFAAAWTEGEAMPLSEVIAHALE